MYTERKFTIRTWRKQNIDHVHNNCDVFDQQEHSVITVNENKKSEQKL